METTHVTIDRAEAKRLYQEYKKHQAYSAPIDWEIQRTYQVLAQGKLVIRAIESVRAAGLYAEGPNAGLPKLALCRADAMVCFYHGSARGRAPSRWSMGGELITTPASASRCLRALSPASASAVGMVRLKPICR